MPHHFFKWFTVSRYKGDGQRPSNYETQMETLSESRMESPVKTGSGKVPRSAVAWADPDVPFLSRNEASNVSAAPYLAMPQQRLSNALYSSSVQWGEGNDCVCLRSGTGALCRDGRDRSGPVIMRSQSQETFVPFDDVGYFV